MSHKISAIIGTRPQFIKAAVVSKAMMELNKKYNRWIFRETIIDTGQHYDDKMAANFIDELELQKPAYNLGVKEKSSSKQAGKMINLIEDVLIKEDPDLVFVYGDTNSTLAGALAAAYLNKPVAHVEAGLRSFDMRMPEEINRKVVDAISTLLFCPTSLAVANLHNEGIKRLVYETGNVLYDSILEHEIAMKKPAISLPANYYFATIHRQENTESPQKLQAIMSAFSRARLPVVMPVHPRTNIKLVKNKFYSEKNIIFTAPVSYRESLYLQAHATAVITDSGGLQEESFCLEKPCITVRETTEWKETISFGGNFLVRAQTEAILQALKAIDSLKSNKSFDVARIYGDGKAGEKIVRIIREYLEKP